MRETLGITTQELTTADPTPTLPPTVVDAGAWGDDIFLRKGKKPAILFGFIKIFRRQHINRIKLR